jgi:hypothetical protein
MKSTTKSILPMINPEMKHANVAEHKEEEEFYVFMARNKDSKSIKFDWYVNSR